MSATVVSPKFKVIGQPIARNDVIAKIAGQVTYSADLAFPGMLHAQLVRSLYPSAELVSIDTSVALEVPGVVAILTASDVPHNSLSEDPSGTGAGVFNQPVLADRKVRYVGEPIAIVVAENHEALAQGVAAVEVNYSVTEGIFDPVAALEDDAPKLYPDGNVCVVWRANKGDVESAKKQAAVQISREYRTQFVDHAYLEPEAGVAWMDSDGCLVVRAATQVIEHYRHIAEIVELPQSRVRVISPYVGGGFGGKEDMTVEPYIALAAVTTGKPVKMVWSRSESLQARPKRHPMVLRYNIGGTADGRLEYMDIEVIGDAGAYAMLSPRVLFASAVVATGPYNVPNVRVISKAVYTNNTPSSAFRGFGAMQVAVGYEQIMDELASELGMDRLLLRRKNYIKKGDTLGTGEEVLTAAWLNESLDAVLQKLGPRPQPSNDHSVVGRGFASNMQPYGRTVWFGDHATAWLTIEEDGSLVVRIGVPDIGGGQAAALCQIASEVLDIPLSKIRPYFGDSALTPLAGGTFATRQLYNSGNAVLKAAGELKEKVLQIASRVTGLSQDMLHLEAGRVTGVGHVEVDLGELVKKSGSQRIEVQSTFYAETGEGYDNVAGHAKRTFPDFTYGCHGCDVEIDTETGEVKVLRYISCHDVGRAINPLSVEGQMQGGTIQGLGYALTEEVIYQEGQCMNGLFAQYLAPVASDVPNIETVILESGEGRGPLNARGIGEPAISPVAPCVANAVADALRTGRVRSLPITPEKVIDELEQ